MQVLVHKITVYVVYASDWDYYEIRAIFLKAADAAVYIDEAHDGHLLDIEEHQLNMQW